MSIIRKSVFVLAAASTFACSHLSDTEKQQEEKAAAERQQRQSNQAGSPERTAQARKATAATRRNPTAAGVEPEKQGKPPDNTGVNERDRSPAAETPMAQGNSPDDLRITADIRKALMKEDGLSFTAKNVKIITRGAHVLLRGPVKNANEKTRIDAIARAAAGVLKVDDELEVEPSGKD